MSNGHDRVLCVDDDGNILEAMQRTLGRNFALVIARGGEEGMRQIEGGGPFAVVVSDLRMPVVDGISLLTFVRERSPATSRVLLTGHADTEHAVRAVNEGEIFRFLTKPCPASLLRKAIEAGIEQYRLVQTKQVLLEQTLRGSIRALTEMVALVHPVVGAQTSRVRRLAVQLCEVTHQPDLWHIEVTVLLANLGLVTLPASLVDKWQARGGLGPDEEALLASAPEVAAKLLANLPHLEQVQSALFYQRTSYDGSRSPVPGVRGDRIPIAARVLRLVTDLDQLTSRGVSPVQALDTLRTRVGAYDPELLEALGTVLASAGRALHAMSVPMRALEPGLVFDEDVRGFEGRVLVGRGAEVTPAMLERIREYWDESLMGRSVRMLVPPEFVPKSQAA